MGAFTHTFNLPPGHNKNDPLPRFSFELCLRLRYLSATSRVASFRSIDTSGPGVSVSVRVAAVSKMLQSSARGLLHWGLAPMLALWDYERKSLFTLRPTMHWNIASSLIGSGSTVSL